MVFFVFLHMMRVFYHGAYKPPREFNWVVGVVLLFLTIMLSFTGYLLPWDQIAYWAITIGTNMGGYAPLFNTPVKLHPAGRRGGGPEHAAALLRGPHHGPAAGRGHLPGRPLLADPQGRRASHAGPPLTCTHLLTASADRWLRRPRGAAERRVVCRSTRPAGRRSTSSACRCRRGRTGCSRWSSRTPSSGSRRNPTTRS